MSDKRFKPEKAGKLFSPERQKLLPVEKILAYLDLEQADSVADLGAGNGYFTVPMAKKVTTVHAVDIEPQMLNMLNDYAVDENVSNIEFITSDLEAINMEGNSVNKVFSAFVMHEISNLKKAFEEINRIMIKGGQLFILDWEVEENPEMGPPPHERISSERFLSLLQENGFKGQMLYRDGKTYGIKATMN
ncbi:class I SAM-dependent methyltransferase [Bacillus sp. Marseille-Q3570]|uniref:class I SAM-dependent methyltransferase n=1 Tax=Bacillus sp. Marseille-Q3570 TaxID=2963522 RepID=UPI0021B73C43|nr:methyltransferase domain-containing protein [Bacillus sp. Marseille-Q3570]